MNSLKKFNFEKIKFKTRLSLFCMLVLIAVLSIVFSNHRLNLISKGAKHVSEHIVKLTKNGFESREVTINKGDIVKFETTLGSSFWPASDPHPTHDYLIGFDPGNPVSSNDSWSYTFMTPGIWSYHNHLDPISTGKIIVLDENGKLPAISNECGNGADTKCWYEKIKEAVDKDGVDAGFSLFEQAYSQGAPLGCHWTSHLIGQEAYKQYKKGNKFKITKATSYCSYGFYHGFMELLLRDNQDSKFALSFCAEVGKQLGSEGQDNCYHGIGHGFTEEPPDKNIWGDANAMLKPGLKVCEKLFGQIENKWEICATGVYTVVAEFFVKQKYGLTFDPEDPFSFCRTQPKRYWGACFGEFSSKLDIYANWDVSKVPDYIKGIYDNLIIEVVIHNIIGSMMQRDVDKPSHDNYVIGCRSFPEKWRQTCFKSVIWGFITHGAPEKQYINLFKFCQSSILSMEEQDFCYNTSLSRLKSLYSLEEISSVCATVPDKYKNYCS